MSNIMYKLYIIHALMNIPPPPPPFGATCVITVNKYLQAILGIYIYIFHNDKNGALYYVV